MTGTVSHNKSALNLLPNVNAAEVRNPVLRDYEQKSIADSTNSDGY